MIVSTLIDVSFMFTVLITFETLLLDMLIVSFAFLMVLVALSMLFLVVNLVTNKNLW